MVAGCGGDSDEARSAPAENRFDAAAAFRLIEQQVALGPRPAGSPASRRLANRLRRLLPRGSFEAVPGGLRNVVGTLPGRGRAIVIGAHYDTEADPPEFVGANDGAAGTAAVLTLARTLKRELPEPHRKIRFVLFDGEEEPAGCLDFLHCGLRGSKAYARAHAKQTHEMILLDYIANKGLRIPRETNSDPELWSKLRAAARKVGAAGHFPAGEQGGILDDHYPFVQRGVPAIDLIDFSYRYRDTLEDTPDKLSQDALDAVGETVADLVLVEARP